MEAMKQLLGRARLFARRLEGEPEPLGPNREQVVDAAQKYWRLYQEKIDQEYKEIDEKAKRGFWKENADAWVAYEKRWREEKYRNDYAIRFAVFLAEEYGLNVGADPARFTFLWGSGGRRSNYGDVSYYKGHPINGDGVAPLDGAYSFGRDYVLKAGHAPLKNFHPKQKVIRERNDWERYHKVKIAFEVVDRDTGKEGKVWMSRNEPHGCYVFDWRLFGAFSEPNFLMHPEKVLQRFFPAEQERSV